jgi:hypothetical protein
VASAPFSVSPSELLRPRSRKTSDRFEHHSLAGTLPKAQTHAASVFVDEVNASRLKGASYDVQSSAPWLTCFVLKLVDSDRANSRAVGKCLLSPAEETSGSSALGGRDAHLQEIAEA